MTKSPFFVKGSFCTPYSICLNIGFWQGSLYGNVAFSIVARSTKRMFSSFSKKVLVFLYIFFKVKLMKTFKIPSDCHIQKYGFLLNGGLFLKSRVPVFSGTFVVSLAFEKRHLRITLLRKTPTHIFP